MQDIEAITLSLPYRLGTVNCYLVRTAAGFVLIDTGASNGRAAVERALADAGCGPGGLRLVVLTHGDFDHTGNAACVRDRYGVQVAMHRGDTGMAELGDMFSGRSSGSAILRLIAPFLFGFRRSNRFKPDCYLEDGDNLSSVGLDAHVVSVPGHSKGSIAILTGTGDLFCGDLLENVKKPAISSIMDDQAACAASIEKLRGFEIDTVYPGHGAPFAMAEFLALMPGPIGLDNQTHRRYDAGQFPAR